MKSEFFPQSYPLTLVVYYYTDGIPIDTKHEKYPVIGWEKMDNGFTVPIICRDLLLEKVQPDDPEQFREAGWTVSMIQVSNEA